MPRRRRARLTRAGVLEAALALADAGGVESLSMRRVAAKLGVEPMSLYAHVAGKDDLVDGLVDIVVAEIEATAPGSADWRTAMRTRALSLRDALERHRWAVGLVARRMGRPAHPDAYVYGCALRDAPAETDFRFGLELILDGLERCRAKRPPGGG
jgi:AcrR family transcriptional regulator